MSKFKMGDVIKVVNDEAKISEGNGLIVDIDGEYYVVKWSGHELTGKHLQKYIDNHWELVIDALPETNNQSGDCP